MISKISSLRNLKHVKKINNKDLIPAGIVIETNSFLVRKFLNLFCEILTVHFFLLPPHGP